MTSTLELPAFEQDFAKSRLQAPAWLAAIQQQAFELFLQKGLPSRSEESWKYTNLTSLTKKTFTRAPKTDSVTAETQALLAQYRGSFAQHTLVFVDGHFNQALSSTELLKKVTLQPLSSALVSMPEKVQAYLNQSVNLADQPFAILNTAMMLEGLFLEIEKSTEVELPIHLIYLTTQNNGANHVRNLIHAAENARVTLMETYVGLPDIAYFNNTVTEIFIDSHAHVKHYKLQAESLAAYHIAGIHSIQHRASSFNSEVVTLGALLSRTDIRCRLAEQHAQCVLNGLYVTHGRQHTDTHTVIQHDASHTVSDEYYKGVQDDYSHAVFNGKVIVAMDAQKISANQSNKNLMLSSQAQIDTKPELQIYANDVKCAHGATVGQLDKNALFYLRARGLTEAQARHILTFAFIQEILLRISLPALAQHMTQHVMAAFSALPDIQEFV